MNKDLEAKLRYNLKIFLSQPSMANDMAFLNTQIYELMLHDIERWVGAITRYRKLDAMRFPGVCYHAFLYGVKYWKPEKDYPLAKHFSDHCRYYIKKDPDGYLREDALFRSDPYAVPDFQGVPDKSGFIDPDSSSRTDSEKEETDDRLFKQQLPEKYTGFIYSLGGSSIAIILDGHVRYKMGLEGGVTYGATWVKQQGISQTKYYKTLNKGKKLLNTHLKE